MVGRGGLWAVGRVYRNCGLLRPSAGEGCNKTTNGVAMRPNRHCTKWKIVGVDHGFRVNRPKDGGAERANQIQM